MTDDDVHDAGRDALALLRAYIADDDQAADAILDNASLRDLASTLGGIAQELLLAVATLKGLPDPAAAVDQQLLKALEKERPGIEDL
jgi:hypothetical protein